ncbi:MAG TPA: FHA domain-containing protein [Bacteroidota bacterium]|nr:FHA domain-containing protein [Bacteroidota bacterium]
MYARLYAKSGLLAGKSYDVVTEAVIGHGPECNLLVKSGVLSAKHARIFYDQKKGSYFLEDLKSYNGTLLDGKPVAGRVKLEKKHVIQFANTFTFIFTVEPGQANDPLPPPPKDIPREPEPAPPPRRKPAEVDDRAPGAPPAPVEEHAVPEPQAAPPVEAQANPFGIEEPVAKRRPVQEEVSPPAPPVHVQPIEAEKPAMPAPPPPPPPPPAPQAHDAAPTMLIDEAQLAEMLGLPRFALEFKSVRGEKTTIQLKEGENTVGRLSTSDAPVDDASISRNHAIITVRGGKVTLKDLGSKNGTYVEDKKITSEVEIVPDTPIRFGLVKATILKKAEHPA